MTDSVSNIHPLNVLEFQTALVRAFHSMHCLKDAECRDKRFVSSSSREFLLDFQIQQDYSRQYNCAIAAILINASEYKNLRFRFKMSFLGANLANIHIPSIGGIKKQFSKVSTSLTVQYYSDQTL